MKLIDRLSRSVRIFRIKTDMRGIEDELRGIRLALYVICREGFNVELDPRRPMKIPADAHDPYYEDGGETDLRKVAAIMEEAGYEIPEEQLEPLGAAMPVDDQRPLLSFLRSDDELEEEDDDSDSNGITTARRARTPAGTSRSAGAEHARVQGNSDVAPEVESIE